MLSVRVYYSLVSRCQSILHFRVSISVHFTLVFRCQSEFHSPSVSECIAVSRLGESLSRFRVAGSSRRAAYWRRTAEGRLGAVLLPGDQGQVVSGGAASEADRQTLLSCPADRPSGTGGPETRLSEQSPHLQTRHRAIRQIGRHVTGPSDTSPAIRSVSGPSDTSQSISTERLITERMFRQIVRP